MTPKSCMRPEHLHLCDIIEAIQAIGRFIGMRDYQSFVTDEVLCSAILQKLTVIGEAAAHISADVRQQYPDVPWRRIVAFRNFAVHEYFAISWPIVWHAATDNIRQLEPQIISVFEAVTLADADGDV